MLEELARNYLLAVAKAYGKATGLTLGAVSRKFYGNSDFLVRMARSGATTTFSKYSDILAKMSASWPAGAEWPDPVSLQLRRPE